MPMPYYALLAVLCLTFLTKIPLARAMRLADSKGYDNRNPRQQQASLSGWGARALAAHQNTFEALTIFTAAIVVANLGGGLEKSAMAAGLAIAHTVARVLYPVFYIADLHLLRSLVWSIGFGSALWLAMLPLF